MKKQDNSALTRIKPSDALKIMKEKGYPGDTEKLTTLYAWLNNPKYSTLGTKSVGKWVVFKEKLLELLETGEIKE